MRRDVALSLALVVTVFASGCGSDGTAPAAPRIRPSVAAERFLERYVTPDGRVIRRDQGGDIVSEGQAYGMLIAELAGRSATVRTIWSWTKAHLRRADGLLQYHASGTGQVESNEPATDADVLAAYALLRYHGTDQDALHTAGRRIAQAVLAAESTPLGGAPVLVAGPWALRTSPPTVNPSYWMPSVFSALATYTGDDRWQSAAREAVTLLENSTGAGRTLPTDWARLSGGRLVPIADPGGGAPKQYGLDAARLPLWLGTACTPGARRLAGQWWTNALATGDRAADLALSPSGTPIDTETNPLPLLAGAAAAAAGGDTAASTSLRARAAQQSHMTPTYYGDAWLALGGALLDGSLDPCHEADGG